MESPAPAEPNIITIGDAEHKYERLTALDEVGDIVAIRGIPAPFFDEVVRMAQVIDVPHSWKKQRVNSIDEVTDEVLAIGRSLIKADVEEMGSRIVTYYAASEESLTLVGAGAIRNRLNKTFQNDAFPVISRAVVHPDFRGKGVGSIIVKDRFRRVWSLFGTPVKALHYATESAKIQSSVESIKKKLGSAIYKIHIGDEQLHAPDGVHKVEDYLVMTRPYSESLLEASKALPDPIEREHFSAFVLEGTASGVSGDNLSKQVLATSKAQASDDLNLAAEFFHVRNAIGAQDPK